MTISHAITAVRTGRNGELDQFKWLNIRTGVTGSAGKDGMVDFVQQNTDKVGVGGTKGWAIVQVVGTGPGVYLRTIRDGTMTDNLFELPRF